MKSFQNEREGGNVIVQMLDSFDFAIFILYSFKRAFEKKKTIDFLSS